MSLTAVEVTRFEKVERWAECAREDVGGTFVMDGMTPEDAELCARLCAPCAVKKTCWDIVQPNASYFSGMCSGFAWNDGAPVGTPRNATRDAIAKRCRRRYAHLHDDV